MSLQTIRIHRDFQIIDGFVQVPNNLEADKNRVTVAEALTTITDSQRLYLSQGSGNNRGWKAGAQSVLRLPGLTPGSSYTTDPVVALASS